MHSRQKTWLQGVLTGEAIGSVRQIGHGSSEVTGTSPVDMKLSRVGRDIFALQD